MEYPIVLTPDDNGTFLVTCPDLPEVTSFGEDREDAIRWAEDSIEEALAARIARRMDIPVASAAGNRPVVLLAPMTAAKVVLYQAARAKGISKAALGRSLAWHGPQVDRLFDVHHSSKLEAIDQVARVLGKRVVITLEDDERKPA